MKGRKNIEVDLGEGHKWRYDWDADALSLPWCGLTGEEIDKFSKALARICTKRAQDKEPRDDK